MMTVPRAYAGDIPHTPTRKHARTRARSVHAYTGEISHVRTRAARHIRQGVEIIKGAWRARGCPDDGHVNQDGR